MSPQGAQTVRQAFGGQWASPTGRTPAWHSLYKSNIDGEGPDDIIGLAFGSEFYHGQVDEAFANPTFRSAQAGSSLSTFAGDFDGDGKGDIVAFTVNDTLWLDITDSYQFQDVDVNAADHIATGNFDSDAAEELCGVNNDGSFFTAEQDRGKFIIISQGQFNITGPVQDVVVGNFDGDAQGLDDIAVYTQDCQVLVAVNTGTGFQVEQWSNPGFAAIGWDGFYAGDFNGEGRERSRFGVGQETTCDIRESKKGYILCESLLNCVRQAIRLA